MLTLAVLFGVALAKKVDRATEEEYAAWQAKRGRHYRTQEEHNFRLQQFEKASRFVKEHNKNRNAHRVELNDFADWTEDEFRRLLGA